MMTGNEKHTILLTLYPLFKQEVYQRREQMMRWTAMGAGSLVTILLVLVLAPARRILTPGGRALLIGGILLLTVTFIMLILQQRQRHQQAKQTLIELERALGLFEDKAFISHGSLYPENWQTDWTHDRSTTLSIALLGLLTLLVLLAITVVS
jgi:DMSO/TMAO reductase YedYZ heme-binding membrane subunit